MRPPWHGQHTFYIHLLRRARPFFIACAGGCKCMQFGPHQGMHHGICHIQHQAAQSVLTVLRFPLLSAHSPRDQSRPIGWGPLARGGGGAQHFHWFLDIHELCGIVWQIQESLLGEG